VLHKLLDRLQRDLLLVTQWLDDFTGLGDDIILDESLIRVLRVPFLANWHGHKSIELLSAVELVWQVLNPVFLGEFLVALFRFIDLNALKLRVLPLLLELLDFPVSQAVKLLLLSFLS